MDDVRVQLHEKAAQGAYVTQGAETLAMHRHLDMLAAFIGEARRHTATGRNHYRFMSRLDQVTGELHRAAFDATGVEFRKDLDYTHGRFARESQKGREGAPGGTA